MQRRSHRRPAFWMAAVGTGAAMAATMALAPPGGAASPEKEYTASTPLPCVVAPGVLNAKTTGTLGISFKGPESVQEAESGIELTGASVSFDVPAEIREAFGSLGVKTIRGSLRSLGIDATNMTPAELNIGTSPGPLPYEAPYRELGPTEIRFPAEGTFSFGPYTVTGKAGEQAALAFGGQPGFVEEAEVGYRATGSGVAFTIEGLNEKGERKTGPLTVACNAPTNVTLATMSITGPPVETAAYNTWPVAGSITDRRLGNQAIALPQGSTFTGTSEVNTATGDGSVMGSFAIPPFTAPMKLFGVIPVSIGITLAQGAQAIGTVSPSESAPGSEALALPVKLDMGVTSVSLLGLKIPTRCTGTEPLSLSLSDTLSREALLHQGWSFAGTTTIPAIRCEGGLLGRLFGAVITGLLSGPENGYTLTVSAPAA